MNIRYTADHEWVGIEDGTATVGITDHAQGALGDLVYVQLPDVGSTVARGEVAGVVESVKAASDLFSPLSGLVTEINAATTESPELVNRDPQGTGWLFKIRFSHPEELDELLDESAYRQLAP